MDEPVEYRTVLMDRTELLARLLEAVELFEMSDACNDPIDKVTSAGL